MQEGKFLHILVDSDRVSQVYASLLKKSSDKNLKQNVFAKYDTQNKQYHITIDPKTDLEHLNGEYTLELHFADKLASNEVWRIGSLSVYFKEGLDEGNNQGYNSQYIPENLIFH